MLSSGGLHWIDLTVIAAYASGMMGLGWYYSRRQESTEEYFVGSRAMNPLLIGISLFATLLSTITYLASPGEMIKHGPTMLWGVLSVPIAYVVAGYCIIPALMRHRLTSAYELLEKKLGLSARLLGALMFITLRLLWMTVLLNFAATALLGMLGLGKEWLLPVSAVIGAVALVYSSMGGLRAVVITDFLQFVLLLGGGILVILMITWRTGGLAWFPTQWESTWDKQPIFSWDPHVRLTIVGVVVMQSLWAVCTFGSDQTAIQRYMATADARAARRSFLIKSLAGVVVSAVLALVGFSLLYYFREFPERLPAGQTIATAADGLFPRFISHEFPIGVSGLVVSGMFAAAMSSLDSGVNSISAVVLTDFVDRSRSAPLGRQMHVRVARLIAVVVGITVIIASLLLEYVPGNFLEVSKRVTGLLVTPLFALFFMALFVPFATSLGTIIGALCGFATTIVIAYWQPLFSDRPLSITLINPCGITVSLTMAMLLSWMTYRPPAPQVPEKTSAIKSE